LELTKILPSGLKLNPRATVCGPFGLKTYWPAGSAPAASPNNAFTVAGFERVPDPTVGHEWIPEYLRQTPRSIL